MACTMLLLTGAFWLVAGEPRWCLDSPIAPYVKSELSVARTGDVITARSRWVMAGGTKSAWSDDSEAVKSFRLGSQPDADGNGFVNANDFVIFTHDFIRGDARRFDFDGNGGLNVHDAKLFFSYYNGQVR